MAYSLSSLSCFNQDLCWNKIMFHYPKMIRSQCFRDNGKSDNSVDANISVLRERIRSLRRKEKLMDTSDGWNYKKSSNHHHHNQGRVSNQYELITITFGSMGLVFLFGSLLIFLVSLLVFITKI